MEKIDYKAKDYAEDMIEYIGDKRIEDIKGKIYFIPPNPDKGFNFGYSIFIPEGCQTNTTLLFHATNTGGCGVVDGKLARNKPAYTLEEGEEAAKLESYYPYEAFWSGFDLKMPVITPIIPRIYGYYTHALGSMVFNNDVSVLREYNNRRPKDAKLTEEQIIEVQEKCYDIPSQVVNMVKDAQDMLVGLGINVDEKVIMEGYSAGSMFSNYFTALHPEMVKACISGGTLGLSIMPLEKLDGEELKFPLGIADIPYFDLDEFKKIPQFYYTGDEDYNDPAEINEEAKKRGEFTPKHPDCYSTKETKIIHEILGDNIQIRFDNCQRIYQQLGINAFFQKFPGNHKSIIQQKDSNGYQLVHEKIKKFIIQVLQKEKEISEDTFTIS